MKSISGSGARVGQKAFARHLLMTTLIASGGSPLSVWAQSAGPVGTPPIHLNVDQNGVDVVTGKYAFSQIDVSIGQGEEMLAFTRIYRGNGWLNPFFGVVGGSGTTRTISIGGQSETFTLVGGVYQADQGSPSTLTYNSSTQIYTYINADGVIATFEPLINGTRYQYSAYAATLTKLKFPSGYELKMTYKFQNWCVRVGPNCDGTSKRVARLQSVNSNTGYQLKFTYLYNPPDTPPFFDTLLDNWYQLTKVTAINNAVEYCDPSASICTLSGTWPEAQYTANGASVTDPLGRVTYYSFGSGGISGIRRPSSAVNNITMTFDGSGRVATYSDGAGTWTYSYVDVGTTRTTTVTDPKAKTRKIVSNLTLLRPTADTNELGKTISYQYDALGRPTRMTLPEGNYTNYGYDSRGNLTTITSVAKSGSGLSNISTSASYSASCTNALVCNKPNSTTDARGFVTNYSYDPTHGGILSVTAPAPATGAVRPQTRYSYTQLYAWYKNSAGSIVASGQPVSLLTSTSTCQTTASCAGAADETRTVIDYGPQTAGTANNLLPRSITRRNGTNTVSATTTMAYDNIGNLASVDGPLSGTGDTTFYRYDPVRQNVGVISPDPDGAGSLKRRAQRISYNADGQVTKVEQGTVDGTTDANWSAFSSLQQLTSTYDGNGRKTKDALTAGGTTYGVTQYSYDSLNRTDCVAQRMNSAVWGTQVANCTVNSAGADGPDRITKYSYDAASRVTKVQTAYGVSGVQADEWTATYTNNGLVATVKDANANLTTYEYDGFDRLSKTRYPSPTKGAGASSTTDYEQRTYDANSNVTELRLRGYPLDSTKRILFAYDNLNRLTLKTLLGVELNVSYGYDLLGRMTAASHSGHALSFTYDALSRNLTQAGPQGTVSYEYDAAGRRTKMTYPGSPSLYVNYDYLVTNEVSRIRENGATNGIGVLASYSYNNLGFRTGATFGNGASASYAPDAISRLSSMTQNLSGTANDITLGFTYNSAGQIKQATRSNDAYAWTVHSNVNRAYTSNGLNQYTAAGTTSLGYDARGNLTSSGSSSYGYSSENYLTSGPGVTLSYDPLGRLYQTVGSATTRLAYDGQNLIAEYNGSNALQRRYVHGPGTDEPVVWYEGSGTADRRWLHADERGSIVAVSNASGAKLGINSYDEYGVPGSTNMGRFQYTGQTWIAELGMYHYKARVYAPALGRFMQTDPIGYGGGMNLYAYVRNDPINLIDPLGEDAVCMPGDICVTGKRNKKNDGTGGLSPLPASTRIGVPPSRTPPSSGRPAGTAQIVVTAQEEPEREQSPCDRALGQSGKIEYGGNTGSLVLLGGLQVSWGQWTNLRTGSTGNYRTVGVGLGLGLGLTRDYGQARSLADFVGYGETAGGGLSLGPVGGSYSATQNAAGEWVAQGGSLGLSPSQPSVSVGKVGVSATASAGETSISGCTVRGQ